MQSQSAERRYDLVIIGAGVTGTALLYVLSKYGRVGKVAMLEKEAGVARVSSHAAHNSQTLHFGDIETNYSLDKAREVKGAAEMIVRYAEGMADKGAAFLRPMQKMVLGVGAKEVAALKARAEEFSSVFPGARLIGPEEILAVEPKVMEGRDSAEPVAAIYSDRGFAVDFGALASSFSDEALRLRPGGIDLFFGSTVQGIRRRDGGGFDLETSRGNMTAAAVVVAAGAHSLHMAHAMGYGLEYTLLPVAGDFFVAPNVLRGKVYTVQEKKLPFAAVHGDPDVADPAMMRFGPVARALPMLEPGRARTVLDFFKVFRPDIDTLATVVKVNSEPIVLRFVLRHLLYYLPFVGKRFFLAEARKIVPTVDPRRLRFARELGGIRPQVADTKKRALLMGEAKITPGDGIIFNITPSPGASVCLRNAVSDAKRLKEALPGVIDFDAGACAAELGSA